MSRHGKRAEGVAQVSVLMDEETKFALSEIAKSQRRTLSNYIAYELGKVVSKMKSEASPIGLAAEDKPAADAPVTIMPKGEPVEYPVRKRQRRAKSA